MFGLGLVFRKLDQCLPACEFEMGFKGSGAGSSVSNALAGAYTLGLV